MKLKGEHDDDTAKGSYGAASLWAKTKIIGAGVFMNLIVAIIMFTLLALVGMPRLVDNQFTVNSDTKIIRNEVLVGLVDEDSPASKVGLEARDRLVSLSPKDSPDEVLPVNDAASLPAITKELAGQDVIINFVRNGEQKQGSASLRSSEEVEASKDTDNPKGYLGVVPTEFTMRRSTWSAPIVGLGITKQFTELTFKGLVSIIAGLFQGDTAKASSQVSGPVGVFVLLQEGSKLGIQFVLMIIAVISLTLAIMNFLPIPALDGGRLFVTYIYKLLKKPLTAKAEDTIHGIGFAVLMLLFVLITVVDVKRFF